jgi:hypothetical protein
MRTQYTQQKGKSEYKLKMYGSTSKKWAFTIDTTTIMTSARV